MRTSTPNFAQTSPLGECVCTSPSAHKGPQSHENQLVARGLQEGLVYMCCAYFLLNLGISVTGCIVGMCVWQGACTPVQ